MYVEPVEVKSILTRTGGFLAGVASHSLQPYAGCSFGRALCGVACYVQHNAAITRGRPWGSFLEARTNAAEVYLRTARSERNWALRKFARFAIFMSSSTDPFVPQEQRLGITRGVLDAMLRSPPDALIVQTHTHRVRTESDRIIELSRLCKLRMHLSIETDQEYLAGLPPHASSVSDRLETAAAFRSAGVRTVVTVSPLLPIADPTNFFRRIAEAADAVVIDHFIEGDGTSNGRRTLRTNLPIVMNSVDPTSTTLEYRDRMVEVARSIMPGRVGVNRSGFAGIYS